MSEEFKYLGIEYDVNIMKRSWKVTPKTEEKAMKRLAKISKIRSNATIRKRLERAMVAKGKEYLRHKQIQAHH